MSFARRPSSPRPQNHLVRAAPAMGYADSTTARISRPRSSGSESVAGSGLMATLSSDCGEVRYD